MSLVDVDEPRRRSPSSRSTGRGPTPSPRSSSPSLRAALARNAGRAALVLASAQPGLFSAGWDLPLISALGPRRRWRASSPATAISSARSSLFAAPLVAALPGHAIAGGLIVAAAADERIAARGQGRVRPLGGRARRAAAGLLPRDLPPRPRRRGRWSGLRRRGRTCRSSRALAIGLLDRVVPAAEPARRRARAGARSSLADRPARLRGDQAPRPRATRWRASTRRGGRSLPRFLVQRRREAAHRRAGRETDREDESWFPVILSDAKICSSREAPRSSSSLDPHLDGIPMIPLDEILEALDLSRLEPGIGFLEALFARFNARVPVRDRLEDRAQRRRRRPGREAARPGGLLGRAPGVRRRRDLLCARRRVRRAARRTRVRPSRRRSAGSHSDSTTPRCS